MRKITLYIGLNDKASKMQEISTLDAYKVVGHMIGRDCTITEGRGVYTHEDGTKVIETSLIVEILDFDASVSREWIVSKCVELKQALNQEAIAVQEQEVQSELL